MNAIYNCADGPSAQPANGGGWAVLVGCCCTGRDATSRSGDGSRRQHGGHGIAGAYWTAHRGGALLPGDSADVSGSTRNADQQPQWFITFAVVAVYLVIAMESHLVVFGFLPLGLSFRSKRLGEPLAPFAIVQLVLSIGVAAIRIFGTQTSHPPRGAITRHIGG